MASSELYIEPQELDIVFEEGTKLVQYLFHDASTLDAAEGLIHPMTLQLGLATRRAFKNQWTDRVETGRAEYTMKTISRALGSLQVGSRTEAYSSRDTCKRYYEAKRRVNFGVFPKGHNIPATLKHDNLTDSLDALLPEHQGRYETVHNIRDGVLIIGSVKRPTGPATESLNKPCEVIGAMFASLSTRRQPTSDKSRLASAGADVLATRAVLEQVPLPPLPTSTAGSWLPAILAGADKITEKMIRDHMYAWLNYIVVHVPGNSDTHVMIDYCLMRLGQWEVKSHIWGNQLTYGLGHWVFTCLLGSDLGRDVAWLLAKRKGDKELGRKAIKSITVFYADRADGLTAEETEKYVTPVMIFEVVTDSEELRAAWRDMDAADGRIPDGPIADL